MFERWGCGPLRLHMEVVLLSPHSHQQVFVRAEFLLKEGMYCLVLLVNCECHRSIHRYCASRVSVWCLRLSMGHLTNIYKDSALYLLGNVDICAVRRTAQANHQMPWRQVRALVCIHEQDAFIAESPALH